MREHVPHGWKRVTLDETKLGDRGLVSGPFGSNIGKRFFVDEGVPVIRGSNLTLGKEQFVDDGFVFVTEEKAYELRNSEALRGDLVFTAAGTLGQVGLIPENSRYPRYIVSNKQLRARCDPSFVLSKFLYFWFSAPRMRDYVANQNTGSSVPLLTLGILRKLPVLLPPLQTQRRIAAILSAYDDLIENNTRRIAILEEMARRLYEEWFVHFRFPGHEGVRMVESEIGRVPEEWEKRRLDQYGSVITGKTPSKKIPEFYGGEIPFLKLPNMHGNMFAIDTVDKLSKVGAASQANKTIPANSLCVSCIGTAGIVNITSKPCQTNQQINSIVLNDLKDREFLFFALKGLREIIHLHGATGATMTNLSRGKFAALTVLHPISFLRDLFHKSALPMLELVLTLQRKNANLLAQRDFLLPKLISGEIEMSDVGEAVAGAAAE